MDNDDQYSERELHRLVRKIDGFCFGNGKAPLEDRIMREVKTLVREAAEHAKNNYRQGDLDIWEAIKDGQISRQHQHDQNVSLFKWVIGLLLSCAGLGLTAIGLLIAVLKK